MAKVTLPSIASGYNPATINSNFQIIADQLNNRVLYRMNVGAEPNQMSNLLDMNNFRIINLPEPLTDSEPARKKDFTIFGAAMDAKVALAAGYANQAKGYSESAQASALSAANSASFVSGFGSTLQTNLVALHQDLTAQLIANGNAINTAANVYAQQAAGSAINANNAASLAQNSASAAVNASIDSGHYAALAEDIASSLAGGTIGFDAVAYDFGAVSTPTTYFNRDFGTLV